MATLTDLGFCQNTIYETIICTFNPDGSPNVAPMGAIVKGNQKVLLTIYNSSRTLENLRATKAATLNLTDDVDVYYVSALKKSEVSTDWFRNSSVVNAPKLKVCDASVALSVDSVEPIDMLRTAVMCSIECINVFKMYPRAYCRAWSAVLEAIIYATRVKVLSGVEAERVHVIELCRLIQNCVDVVNRSAPDSHYVDLMLDLQEKVGFWSVNI